MLYADDRRLGAHGIGRFAQNVLASLEYCPVRLRTDPDLPLDPLLLSWALKDLKSGDVFFSPGYNPPLRCPVPFIITLHDLNHLDCPENSSFLKRLYYELIIKGACHRAARIATVSEFSRKRILEWSGVSPEKVVNVGNGVGPSFHPGVRPYEFPHRYVLCVSNRRKHKNEIRQVEAFARSGLSQEMHLVFTGDPTEELSSSIERNGLTGCVDFLGQVANEQLPSLYRSAQVLLFVSAYEGFGLPVIEAMACGTPVLTSNSTALAETAGGAALLVSPDSTDEIATALRRIALDPLLRARLQQLGLERARCFSWDKTARSVQDLIAQCGHSASLTPCGSCR